LAARNRPLATYSGVKMSNKPSLPPTETAAAQPAAPPARAPLFALLGLALAGALFMRATPHGPLMSNAAQQTISVAQAGGQTATVPVATTLAASTSSTASTLTSSTITPDMRREFEALIKDYLVKNPEVMMEVQTALEAKMEKITSEKMASALKENAKELFQSAAAPIAGNPKGDITVVEFFDYNCGYCKKALPDLAALVQADKNVRVVLKEFPILSKGSEEASKAALAAKMQGKYWDFHTGMLAIQGQANEASALKVAEKAGLDIARLKKDMASAEVKKEIDDTRALAQKMGISGTPHFLVGDKVIAGAPENLGEVLAGHVSDVRKAGGCKVCGG
jgi:protein-disulfide isomerase